MAIKVIYSKIAFQDLREIYNNRRIDSLAYAHREVQSIRYVIHKLKANPLLGRKFKYSENAFTRELIFKNYRIVYEYIFEVKINILTLHHHSRLIANIPAFIEA